MENVLVVTALRCAFALNQHFQGASEPGRDGGAQTADAHNSRPRFLLSGKKREKKKSTPRSAGDQLALEACLWS